jgi:hypothetical protein
MWRTIRLGLALLAALWCGGAPVRANEPVDLLLVLAADVSRSVNHVKFQLQREGYAAAIADKRVLEAISAGRHRRIAVCFVEWSGANAQQVVIDWSVISDDASARKFGDQLLELPRSFADRTSIGGTIDISGDGTHNSGRDVTVARDEAVAQGVTINGLVILSDRPMAWNPEHTHPPGGLVNYFRNNVIGGPGAFVVTAENFEAFGQAIVKKMIAEIAEAPQTPKPAAPGG